jgi:hypothetical protein
MFIDRSTVSDEEKKKSVVDVWAQQRERERERER